MNIVYLLYGIVDRFDEDGEHAKERCLLAIYKDKEEANAAIFDYERKTNEFDFFGVEAWGVH